MGVISFCSLKGGVGKTALSINVAHAFAKRGCKTLLIDCDPTAQASKHFGKEVEKSGIQESPLARLFLTQQTNGAESEEDFESAFSLDDIGETPIITNCRPNFDLLPGSPDLRHFFWGSGARTFRSLFPVLIDELQASYDHIVIDTAPDFNIITRNVIAISDLITVPVDSSMMSINCLDELITSAAHIKRPTWTLVRSMVNRKASRIHKLAVSNLQSSIDHPLWRPSEVQDTEDDFLELLKQVPAKESLSRTDDNSPIYLLNSMVRRTEQQNRLSFVGKTSHDLKETKLLSEEYFNVARELEELLSIMSDVEPEEEMSDSSRMFAEAMA